MIKRCAKMSKILTQKSLCTNAKKIYSHHAKVYLPVLFKYNTVLEQWTSFITYI